MVDRHCNDCLWRSSLFVIVRNSYRLGGASSLWIHTPAKDVNLRFIRGIVNGSALRKESIIPVQ